MSVVVVQQKAPATVTINGGPAGGPPPPFDPSTLALTAWFRNYAGAPYAGSASAGTSGTNSPATTTANDPTIGTPLNGHGTDATTGSENLALPGFDADYFSSAGFSVWVLFFANTASSDDPVTPYTNPGVMGDASGAQGATFSDAGFGFYCISGSYVYLTAACGTGAWHLGQIRCDGTDLQVRVDDGAWQTTACPTPDVDDPSRTMRIGIAYVASLDGMVAERAISKVFFDDATFDEVRSYCLSEYGVSV